MKPFEIIYVVSVNKINKKEVLLIAVGSIIATFAFYFLLKALNTNELIVSTLSLIFSLIASYLMLGETSIWSLNFTKDKPVHIDYNETATENSAKLTSVRYLITVRPDTIDNLLPEKGYIKK